METPFSAHFGDASIPLTQVDEPPFVPLYPMPFVPKARWVNLVGDGIKLIYRVHDGFDVFVGVLEVYTDAPANTELVIPVETLLSDLHLGYQLAGRSSFPDVSLPALHHIQVYAPPALIPMTIQADPDTLRYAAGVAVPKGRWVSREANEPENPFTGLIQCLKAKQRAPTHTAPSLFSDSVRTWTSLLFNTPAQLGMNMDSALSWPVGNLVAVHKAECDPQTEDQATRILVDTARAIATRLVWQLDGDRLPTVPDIAALMDITPKRLWHDHQLFKNQSFNEFLNDSLMDRAKALLDAGLTAKTVSLKLGYSSPNNFSRAFTRKFGFGPKAYLNIIGKK